MVSFQCHSCGDVVKKPKLDQHRSLCHGGFDCIDCSTTFNTPAEYKGHTSCISEAEKYQKGLYKGPKKGRNGQSNDNQNQPAPQQPKETTVASASRQSNAQWNRIPQPTSSTNVNGYPGPHAQQYSQRRQPQPHWQNGRMNNNDHYANGRGGRERRAPRPSASGANGTPLGTPRRTSPTDLGSSTTPTFYPNAGAAQGIHGKSSPGHQSAAPETNETQNHVKVDKVEKKKAKEDVKGTPEDLKTAGNAAIQVEDSVSAIEGKRDKKKKSKKGDPEAVGSTKDDDIGTPRGEEVVKKKRKEKKEEKRKEKDPEPATKHTEGIEATPPTAPKKEKKRKRKDRKLDGEMQSTEEQTVATQEAEPVKKEKKRKNKGVNGIADSIDERRTRIDEDPGKDVNIVEANHHDLDTKKKSKKRKLQEDDVENKKKKRKTNTAEAS